MKVANPRRIENLQINFCLISWHVRFVEISVERKRKKKRQLVHGISSLSPQFCLICPARTSSKINSCMFARVRVLRVQFFYALNSCRAISLLPLFPPIFSDGISPPLCSRSLHAGHRSNRRWVARMGGRRESVESGGELEKSREQWIR